MHGQSCSTLVGEKNHVMQKRPTNSTALITDKVHNNHVSESVSLNSNFLIEIHHHEFKNTAATVSSFVTLTFQGHRISLAARVSQWLQNRLTLHISYSTKNSLPFFSLLNALQALSLKSRWSANGPAYKTELTPTQCLFSHHSVISQQTGTTLSALFSQSS